MVGIDVVHVSRIENVCDMSAFIDKYFSVREKKYVFDKNERARAQTVAGLFAAKEAVLKAFKIGLGRGIALKNIEILHDESGSPYLNITVDVSQLLKTSGHTGADISISHDGDYAVAVCQLF